MTGKEIESLGELVERSKSITLTMPSGQTVTMGPDRQKLVVNALYLAAYAQYKVDNDERTVQ